MTLSIHLLFALFFTFVQLFMNKSMALRPIDPAKGFISLPFNHSYYEVQSPYNIPQDQRYGFFHGIHKLWVYSDDKPHSRTSRTKPRTEIGINGYSYTSGVWQFEGYGYVPKGTSGVCIMQVFGARTHATTLMLWVYNGSLHYYGRQVLVPNIYNKWFRLNVIHDVSASRVKVFVNGKLKLKANGRGGTYHTFKFGVYAQRGDSRYMESRWKNIKVMKKLKI